MKNQFSTIWKWIIAIIGTIGIFGGTVSGLKIYFERQKDIDSRIFTSADMRIKGEEHLNSGYSETKNLEALNKLTDRYETFTIAIDTLGHIYYKAFDVINSKIDRDQAILMLVNRMDSVIAVQAEQIKTLERSNKIQSNATQLALDNIATIKIMVNELSNFSGD